MKKLSLLLFASFIIFTSVSAKEKTVIGSWLLTKVMENGNVEELYSQVTFKEDGYATWDGRVFGKWEQNKKLFTIESKMIKEFSAKWEISKFENDELILEKPSTKLFFIRLDKDKMEEANRNCGLEGRWKIEKSVQELDNKEYNDEEREEEFKSEKTIIFTLPDKIKILGKFDGGTSSASGTWMYNKAESSLIIMMRDENIGGVNKVLKLTNNELILENNTGTIRAVKVETENIKIERLGFTEEDFFDENGDSKYYEDIDKLPWNDYYQMIESLEKVVELVYNYSIKLKGTEFFDTKEIVAKVNASLDDELIDINNIFENGDSYSFSENQEYNENPFDNYNRLYPIEGKNYSFRVAGNEKITTKAGTFDCTIIDACGRFEKTSRIWMINDKPGIFAKLIEEEPGSFDDDFTYKIFELKEIK